MTEDMGLSRDAPVLSVFWAGVCVWTADAGIALLFFFVNVSDGEEQYYRYYDNR